MLRASSPVDEIVEDDEDEDGHDGGGEEGVDDEALGEPLDVVGVRAQARHLKVDGAVRLHRLRGIFFGNTYLFGLDFLICTLSLVKFVFTNGLRLT